MSREIDSKVVEMSFDNKNFESNVQQSLGTLEKLKKSLDFGGASKGLENLDSTSKKLDFSSLSSALEGVKTRFSAMEIVAITALSNITNSIVNTGRQMLNSLTIEPISMGFEEYELKMGSVQTIMASTGASLEEVNGYLAELNTYSDKTIYSFSDMTNNIGKFTNAGVKLEDAVLAIKGISNEAALSGANAQEASRAMYNFSQALSAGYVKLIDWKSIENANMATEGFKNELIKTAVECGTLEKAADGMYKTVGKGTELNAVKNFNDTLQEQWMTTEVLTKTLSKYADENSEIGKKAYAAAQDVKTFSMMMDTLKEAVQSGWSESFELIFGDFEEAKALWTDMANAFGDLIANSSDARNTILRDWKELGGRQDIIDSFWNIYNAIASIVTTVKEAFNDIFPSLTGQSLKNISASIKDVTAKVAEFTDKHGQEFYNIFAGIFSVLNMGVNIVKAVAGGITELATTIAKRLVPAGSNISDFVQKISLFLINLNKTTEESGIFKEKVEEVVDFIKSIPAKVNAVITRLTGYSIGGVFENASKVISKAYEKIKEVFAKLGEIDLSGLKAFSSGTEEKLSPVKALFEGLKTVFGAIGAVVVKLSPVFSTLATHISEGLQKVGAAISDGIQNGNFETLFELFNSGVFAAIGVFIAKFIKGLSDLTSGSSGIKESITEILDTAKESLEAFQEGVKAKMLKDIAIALGVLTASLLVLSMIDGESLARALAAMAVEFGEMIGALKLLTMVDSKGVTKIASALIPLGAAVLILASAVKLLSTIEWESLQHGLIAVAALLGMLVVSANLMGKNTKNMKKAASGLISFAIALNLLVVPVKALGSMDTKALEQGIMAVSILTGVLTTAGMLLQSYSNGMKKSASGLMTIAAAITLLVVPVKILGAMDMTQLEAGLVGVGVLCAEIAGFLKIANLDGLSASTGIGIVALAGSITILSQAVKAFAQLDRDAMVQGLVAVEALIVGLTFFTKMSSGSTGMLQVGVAMIALGAAMLILQKAVASFGGMDVGTLAVGLGVLGGTLLVLAVAGGVMGPVVPVLLGLSAAIALLGVGALACGAGILALSAGLTALSVSGAAGIGALTLAIIAIVDLIPGIAVALGKGFIAIVKTIGESASVICETVVQVVGSIIDALRTLIPKIVEFLVEVLSVIESNLPTIVEKVINIVLGLLASLRDHIGDFTTIAVDIVTNFLNALAEKMPDIVDAGFNIIISLIDGLGNAMVNNAETLRTAVVGFLQNFLDAVLTFLGIHSPSTVFSEIGSNIVLGLINGIGSLISSAVDIIITLAQGLIGAIAGFLRSFFEKGKEIIGNIVSGISNTMSNIKDTISTAITNAVTAVKDKLKEFLEKGKEIITNIVNGIKSKVSDIKTKITTAMTDSIKAIKDKLTSFLAKGKEIVNNIKDGIADRANSFKTKVGSVIEGGITTIGDKLGSFLDKGKELINNLINGANSSSDDFSGAVAGIVDGGANEITNAGGTYNSGGSELGNQMKSGIEGAIDEVKTAASVVTMGGYDTITGYYDEYYEAGGYLVDGVKNGYEAKVWEMVEAVRSSMRQAFFGAKEELQINSPSKKFAELGMGSDEGYAKGVETYAYLVTDSVKDMSKSAMGAMRESISSLNNRLSGDLNANPTITPVIDLTNFNDGIRDMNNSLYNRRINVNGSYNSLGGLFQNGADSGVNNGIASDKTVNYSFVQNNYSPKALSRIDIYRQTKNQFSSLERRVSLA